MTIAQKMGMRAHMLKLDDIEDFWMGKAIEEADKVALINTEEFLKNLKQ